jgi:hypothetical protein
MLMINTFVFADSINDTYVNDLTFDELNNMFSQDYSSKRDDKYVRHYIYNGEFSLSAIEDLIDNCDKKIYSRFIEEKMQENIDCDEIVFDYKFDEISIYDREILFKINLN